MKSKKLKKTQTLKKSSKSKNAKLKVELKKELEDYITLQCFRYVESTLTELDKIDTQYLKAAILGLKLKVTHDIKKLKNQINEYR